MLHGFTQQHKTKVALGLVALLVVAGGAYAFWTGSGTGSGNSEVGTSGAVTLTATVADGVAPGISVPVSFAAANPSDSPIQVTTVRLDNVTADAGHAACETADFSMEDVTQNHQVPAGATVEALPTNGSLVYANSAVNQDACKGATLTLSLTSL